MLQVAYQKYKSNSEGWAWVYSHMALLNYAGEILSAELVRQEVVHACLGDDAAILFLVSEISIGFLKSLHAVLWRSNTSNQIAAAITILLVC